MAQGTDLVPALLADGDAAAPARRAPGERIAELVAAGPPKLVRAGRRASTSSSRASRRTRRATTLALEDAEVLAAAPASDERPKRALPRSRSSLRVTVRQAVYLAAAQSFAREIRVLPGRRPTAAVGSRACRSIRASDLVQLATKALKQFVQRPICGARHVFLARPDQSPPLLSPPPPSWLSRPAPPCAKKAPKYPVVTKVTPMRWASAT